MRRRSFLAWSATGAAAAVVPAARAQSDGRPLLAVLAPLEGEHGDLGRRAWRNVAMALPADASLRAERFDTSADPVAAYLEARAAGAAAVLGPLGDVESRAVIEARRPGDPPVFLLTASRGLERPSDGVFRLRTTPADQAEALAAHSCTTDDGEHTFAALYPEDAYGRDATLAFVASVRQAGGVVLRAVGYETGEPDVSAAVAQLTGAESLRLAVPQDPWREPPRARASSGAGDRTRPGYLFLPDFGPQIAAVLPHLAFRRWLTDAMDTSVRLLGLSGWASPALESVGDLAAGAQFVSVFDVEDVRGSAEAFSLEYRVRFEEDPTELDAQVFDATQLLVEVLSSAADPRDPSAVGRLAHAVDRHSGVCGDLWIAADGGVVRDLTVWEVDGSGRRFPVSTIRPVRAQ